MRAAGGETAALAWSPVEAGALALGGSGHVSMWRCAATFTGAKLQGELAHFGVHAPADASALLFLHGGQAPEPPSFCVCLLWCHCPSALMVNSACNYLPSTQQNGFQCNAMSAVRSPALGLQENRMPDSSNKRAQLVTPSAEGGLLLWAGGAVSALVLRPGGLPAHVGGVHVLAGSHSDGAARVHFFSAGADGCGSRGML